MPLLTSDYQGRRPPRCKRLEMLSSQSGPKAITNGTPASHVCAVVNETRFEEIQQVRIALRSSCRPSLACVETPQLCTTTLWECLLISFAPVSFNLSHSWPPDSRTRGMMACGSTREASCFVDQTYNPVSLPWGLTFLPFHL